MFVAETGVEFSGMMQAGHISLPNGMELQDCSVETDDLDASLANHTVADAMISSPKTCGLGTSVAQLREFFTDSHVHAALVVENGELWTVVERVDLDVPLALDSPAVGIGHLKGRTTGADADLLATWQAMTAAGRRRLAVVAGGRLLGLLCLKRSGLGFCSDSDVRARECGSEAGDIETT